MKKFAYSALFAFSLVIGYGCDQSGHNTEKQQPDEETLAKEAANAGYGSDTTEAGSTPGTATKAGNNTNGQQAADSARSDLHQQ